MLTASCSDIGNKRFEFSTVHKSPLLGKILPWPSLSSQPCRTSKCSPIQLALNLFKLGNFNIKKLIHRISYAKFIWKKKKERRKKKNKTMLFIRVLFENSHN